MRDLRSTDPLLYEIIVQEEERQTKNIELIASENFTTPAVMEAAGSCLTNKYAEGYPKKRYYGGCEVIDRAEELAIGRAKELFLAEHANVQPHSGCQANMAVYLSSMPVGGTLLAMNLAHGGHLSHGSKVSITGKYYHAIHYGVRPGDERIDDGQVEELALTHRPELIIAGASAYPRSIDFESFREIASKVGAYLMVDMAHIAGLVAAGLHPNPVPLADFVTSTTHKTLRGTRGGLILCKEEYSELIDKAIFPGLQGGPLMHSIAAKAVGFKEALEPEFKEYQRQTILNAKTLAEELMKSGLRLVSGGTDNHLLLVDLENYGMTGREAEELLSQIGITVNKNSIPFDTRTPRETSGIRIGTPAVTTRGMREGEMSLIAQFIHRALENPEDEKSLGRLSSEVGELTALFPIWK